MFSPQRVHYSLLRILAVLLLLLVDFGTASGVSATPFCEPAVAFGANRFSNPTTINNRWFPLTPGTQLVLDGQVNASGGTALHRVIFTVTALTKVINGVRTLVIWDRDFNAGQLAEAELAFFAQDNAGNVWNLGEYPEEYEGGHFAGAPSTWIAGVAGAQGGIHMLASPHTGTG